MVAGRNGVRDGLAHQHRADRHPGPQGLAEGRQVGAQPQGGGMERTAGAAQTALDLVGDQQRAGPLAGRVHGRRERRGQRPHAALALDRLEDDGGHVRPHRGLQRPGVGGRHETHAGQERLERTAIAGFPRRRQRAERAAVKRTLESDDARPPRLAARVPAAARELQAGFHRLGPAVAEERPRQPRQRRQSPADLPLQGMEIEVGRVDQGAGLVGEGVRQPGMGVAQRRHPEAGHEVQQAAAVGVADVASLTAGQHHGHALVDLQQVRALDRPDVLFPAERVGGSCRHG